MDSLQFLTEYKNLAIPLLVLLMLAESAPVVGLFVPGVVILTALGTMTGSGVWPFWTTYFSAVAGALLGDQLGYWLGRLGATELSGKLFRRRRQNAIEVARQLVEKHGLLAIFFGRMAWAVHPAVPTAAGFLGIKPRNFLLIDLPAVSLWVSLYMGLGHVATGIWVHQTFRLVEFASVLAILLVIVLLVRHSSGGFHRRKL